MMTAPQRITKVAIVGAGGRVGSSFAKELLKTGQHTITALTRTGGKTTLPEGVQAVPVDYGDDDSIVSALKGQEFLIITLSVSAPKDLHERIVKAAAKAGVRWIMPNIFGGDAMNEGLPDNELQGPLYAGPLSHVKEAGVAYIVLVCGFWYEWSLGLPEPWYGFDIRKRTVTFYDDGETKINTSTWHNCGRALAALLSLPETGASPSISDWKNKALYVSSFRVSQGDMLNSLHRVLGTNDSDWKISYENTRERYERGMAALKAGDRMGFATALYARAFFPDGSGDFESSRGLSNGDLALPEEDLDEATRRTVEMVEGGFVEETFRQMAGG